MRKQAKPLSIFILIYALAFCVFRMNAYAQVGAAPAATPAAAPATSAATPTTPAATPAATTKPTAVAPEASAKPATKRFKKVFATFETSKGTFKARLFHNYTPKTVENFIGLAEGTKSWQDPKTQEWYKNKPLYKDVPFHRVIKGFMIQTGDPIGTGYGGPGYTFDDEAHPDLKHDKAGLLSMANAGRGPDGRGTNGSQFFITLAPAPHLDRLPNSKHTVFGEVVEGLDVVQGIGNVPTNKANDRPKEDVLLKKVTITRE